MRASPRSAASPAPGWQERLERTARVLEHELRRGCRDDVVIGGLARLAIALRDDPDLSLPPAAREVPGALVHLLHSYAALGPAERRAAVERAIALLQAATSGETQADGRAARAEPGRSPAGPRSLAEPARANTPAAAGPRRGEWRPLPPASAPIAEVKGIGPTRAKLYGRLGIERVGDLLYHFPSRHLPFPPPCKAAELLFQQTASVVGRLTNVEVTRSPRGLNKITATIADSTGQVQAVWFRSGAGGAVYGAISARPGDLVAISGPVSPVGGRVVFEDPEWELAELPPTHTRRLVPVYPLTNGVNGRTLRELIRRAVDQFAAALPDPLPEALRQEEDLPPLARAIAQIHFPDDERELERARRRLAFDELLLLQLMMQRRRQAWQESRGPVLTIADVALAAFVESQPFRFTNAQRRVLEEIRADLARPTPMARLLQGEVGAGKTAVAAGALLIATAAGAQSVLMAPTEILAEQHARSLSAFYERAAAALRQVGAPVPRLALLVGSLTRKEKQEVYDQAAAGELDILVGTHALIQEGLSPSRLGLVIVDEQHRFGVRQRLALAEKGRNPHLLVMTATPIPRTLALSLYGDLDLSLLDEMPPGRQPVLTRLLTPEQRRFAYEHLRRQVAQGRQAFIICPLVEDSPHLEARAATEEFERLRAGELRGLRLALLHGRMRPQDKEDVMRAFRAGEFDVLVSTAVVEVGVDVPNATVMLIEGAERFGLAQLHQFRGRVGRGQHPGVCILLTDQPGAESHERLRALTEAASGLELAEIDLKLRGPGDYFGERQSGLPEFKVASLADLGLIERTRRAAARLLRDDPRLEQPEHATLRAQVEAFVARAAAPS